ncbi:N-acetylglucosaminyl transferase component-domain-containing protein [Mycena floridula]|nr:N-acetylglucosaminyl transferase component-domain-containing protein [Mycena floridula]
MASTTTTVFWPLDVQKSGICYGWLQNTSICVSGVSDTEEDAKLTLESSSASLESCGGSPIIIGRCKFDGLHCFLDVSGRQSDYNIIYYYRHPAKSLRFYSLDVLVLDPMQAPEATTQKPDFLGYSQQRLASGINETVVNQFNLSMALDPLPQRAYASRMHRYMKSIFAFCYRILSGPVSGISRFLTTICGAPLTSSSLALRDLSNTLQQIDVRAEQADFLVTDLNTLSQRQSTPIAMFAARYTNFFNTVWLILNDITIGFAWSAFVCENHAVLAEWLNSAVENVLISWVQWVLHWLDSWPAGLKLNTELSRFYSHTFIDGIALWGGVLQKGAPYLPSVIYAFGVASCGGMTLSISLFSDLFALLTAHIYVCYIISNAVYGRLLTTARSLWNLFRGKRYNVLRNRTDSWEYDMDQLLFGTILFTLLAFLFPTVLAYYALFALMRLGTILIHACMETQLAFMNHFPLFALMLRAKDPWRLPGGIYFERQEAGLVVKNQPVPFSSIFFQYVQLWSRLAAHYNPIRLLRCLLTGEFLAPIPRYSIRYNKIQYPG